MRTEEMIKEKVRKELEEKIVKKIKNQRLLLGELQKMNMESKRTMGRHEGYLEAIEDLLGLEKYIELENKAVELIKKELEERKQKEENNLEEEKNVRI